MEKPLQPKSDTSIKKIWKDNVWGSVIAGVITTILISVGGYLLLGVTGPNVNVCSGEGLHYETLFHVSEGEYFHIIENGREDVVHEKAGRWKRISYEGQKGWLFSAYMRCKQ